MYSLVVLLVSATLTAQVVDSSRYGGSAGSNSTDSSAQKSQPAPIGGYLDQTAAVPQSGVPFAVPAPITGRAADVSSNTGDYPAGRPATGASAPASMPIGSPYIQSRNQAQPPGVAPIGDNFGAGRPNAAISEPPRTESARTPAAMMRAILSPQANSRLIGQSVTLDDVVAGATSRSDQSERVEAYWDLCSSLADYYLGLREQGEFATLKGLFPRSSAVDQAEKDLAVRVGTAERGARAAQLRLTSLCGRSADRLPLPQNLPHCGSYQTRHDQVFSGRSSVEADELSQLIPLRYMELQDASEAVLRSEDWMKSLATSRMASNDEGTVLRGLELLVLQRRAFVQIARDYNRRISRYVELAAPGQVEPERLISMLIKRDRPATATRSSSGIPPINRQSQIGPDGRQTFGDDGWSASDAASTARRDDSVTPVSGETTPIESGERSVLVIPQR